ncbi:hypothetical protein K435DRAFT_786154 [Dendrothele bispora CBS 962.96]|uniref:Glutathione S-transferase UstS-like C-terminal domain-containing protein n=1 Tax=Dendrothele bispora (strain CBS 962.96) TaxID=1314807 RepID=A0A4S8KSL2_DENBC|nr:hypothetical protein K435DRAFT_786154 [Dendrothele bispora CBS 962.96]
MSDGKTLVFFDIPSKIGAWSPNTWKTRYSLNYKGIPYKTVWVESPDIAKTLKDLVIAAYMTQPDVPKGTEVLQKAHINAMKASLNERSEYFRRTKEEMEGQTMEEMYPKGEKWKEEWKKLEKGFGQVDKWCGKEDVLVMGGKEKACFADFAFVGYVIWIRILFGKESEKWKDVSGWQDGRWGRMIQTLEQYK